MGKLLIFDPDKFHSHRTRRRWSTGLPGRPSLEALVIRGLIVITNGRWSAAELVFTGRGLDDAFVDFVADRARRFSLNGWVAPAGPCSVAVTLRGPDALIDMLEIACLLGPVDCLVEDVTVRLVDAAAVPDGFGIRAPRAGSA